MSILDKPYTPGVTPHQQSLYHPLKYGTYCPVLVSFNNCGIITFSYKSTISEAFEDIHQFVLDGISEIMDALARSGKNDFSILDSVMEEVWHLDF